MAQLTRLLLSVLLGAAVALNSVARVKEQRIKHALFIHSGVMRNYKKLWPVWEKNFIKPSQAAGVQFTMAVSTDLGSWCDPDADDAFLQENHQNPTKNGCACMRLDGKKCGKLLVEPTAEAKSHFMNELQKMYGPSSKDGKVYIHDGQSTGRHAGHVYNRAFPVLEAFQNQTFDYIIVTRPDIVLADSHNFSFLENEFNLVSLCNKHPGMNIISGAFVRNNDDVHHRDWDWGYILCDGANAEKAKAVLYDDVGTCSARVRASEVGGIRRYCAPPQRSADWVGNGNFSCNSRACSWFDGMEGKMRLGTLDDALFGLWPPKPVGWRDEPMHPYGFMGTGMR